MNHSNGWTDSGFSCSLPNLVANKDKQSKDQVYIYLLIDFGIKKLVYNWQKYGGIVLALSNLVVYSLRYNGWSKHLRILVIFYY